MKILCICQYGHSRSVCLARALQARGHEAVAVGWETAPSAISCLCIWAEAVVILQASYDKYVPGDFCEKLHVMDVGPDRWANPYSRELRKILDDMIDKKGW